MTMERRDPEELSPEDSRAYYDDYVDRQAAVGVNDRHRTVMAFLTRFGLGPGARVLEIGCGIGTLTGLLAEAVGPRGTVLALDLSPRSIEVARERLGSLANVELEAIDVFELRPEGRFDVVVLADVVEHIPLSLHSALFERIAEWVADDGFTLLNYPNPVYLEWCYEHEPEGLQLIDQPVHADTLLANAYAHGHYLQFLETHSVWVKEGDYVIAVLRLRRRDQQFTHLPERVSLRSRVGSALRRLHLR